MCVVVFIVVITVFMLLLSCFALIINIGKENRNSSLLCSRVIAKKCSESKKQPSSLVDVVEVDLQARFTFLRMCGQFLQDVHLARATPNSLDALVSFKKEVRKCSVLCSAILFSDGAWNLV